MIRFCDFECEYAQRPDKLSDGARSCRTFVAVHCTKLDRLVYKNSPCAAGLKNDDSLSGKAERKP